VVGCKTSPFHCTPSSLPLFFLVSRLPLEPPQLSDCCATIVLVYLSALAARVLGVAPFSDVMLCVDHRRKQKQPRLPFPSIKRKQLCCRRLAATAAQTVTVTLAQCCTVHILLI
jgi:hypothetical protein